MLETTKRCKYCDEEIKANAIKCKHCGSMLTDSGVPTGDVTPESQLKIVLSEKYKIIDEIGRGAMASVYKALQTNLNRTVALKVIHRNLVHNEELLQRFHREAQVSASLNHPNLVTIFDEGSENDVHYMAMEYIDGIDVHTLIKNEGILSKEKTIKIISTIADALNYTHSKRLIHRDVKSSNILLTKEGRCVLSDFGLAHAVSDSKLTQTGTVMGTPDYMSPEQAEGRVLDKRSDIYSLGVVMYECLTGKLPFKGDTIIATIYNITTGELFPANKANPIVPDWLSSISTKMLCRNIEYRFQNAAEVSRALKARKPVRIISNTSKKLEHKKQTNTKSIKVQSIDPIKSLNQPNVKTNEASKTLRYTLIAAIILLVASFGYLLTEEKIFNLFDGRSGGGNWSELNDQERKNVEVLLDQGDDLYLLRRLVTPTGRNAAHNYNEVLRYHTANKYAQKRMRIIADDIVFLINRTMLDGQLTDAERLADASLEYYPNDKDFNKLRKEIDVHKKEYDLRELVLTNRDSALVLANVMLELDSNNTFANYIIDEIKIGYISQGDSLFEMGKLKDAKIVYNKIIKLFGASDIIIDKIKKSKRKIVIKNKIDIPNVIGMSVNDAVALLQRSGLSEGKISRIVSSVRNKNIVINQIPRSGSVKRGTAVNLIVGE
ncbi:MAG: protein kinase [Ignavibacteria bacterium]|nr:protein kinase [Ignavibacteria bacterium]